MLPDEMEAEKNRKMLLSQADKIEILRKMCVTYNRTYKMRM